MLVQFDVECTTPKAKQRFIQSQGEWLCKNTQGNLMYFKWISITYEMLHSIESVEKKKELRITSSGKAYVA